jgi:hypothetical protein
LDLIHVVAQEQSSLLAPLICLALTSMSVIKRMNLPMGQATERRPWTPLATALLYFSTLACTSLLFTMAKSPLEGAMRPNHHQIALHSPQQTCESQRSSRDDASSDSVYVWEEVDCPPPPPCPPNTPKQIPVDCASKPSPPHWFLKTDPTIVAPIPHSSQRIRANQM